MSDDFIYLDHAATTPIDPRVLDTMLPWLRDDFGNAASRHHRLGRRAAAAVERAREQVAATIAADPREIVWTSGATESNNLALKGLAASPAYRGRRHIVTVRTEHKAILDPCLRLEREGYDVTRLPVDRHGRIDLDELAAALRDDTLVCSIMSANNEIGVRHPIDEIGGRCRARGILFHTDATQVFAKHALDVDAMNIDLLSFSAHKIYGPKGTGGLYVRRARPRVRLDALIDGGGHERGHRSGTLNVPGIVGLGAAATIYADERDAEATRLAELRDRLERAVVDTIPDAAVNASSASRLPGITSLRFANISAESLIRRLPDLAVSTASACTTAVAEPSHVLGAMGFDDDEIAGSLRFSLGRSTTTEDIDRAVDRLARAVAEERDDDGETASACSV